MIAFDCFQLARSESEPVLYNLTTIEPDEETINTLIDAVDTAVTSLQNAIGGSSTSTTTDSSAFSNYDYYNYDLEDFNPPELPDDYFTGNEYYDLFDPDEINSDIGDYGEIDYGLNGKYSLDKLLSGKLTDLFSDEELTDEEYQIEIPDEEEIVIEESQLTEITFNSTVSEHFLTLLSSS